jgi:hypothetical protein
MCDCLYVQVTKEGPNVMFTNLHDSALLRLLEFQPGWAILYSWF